MIPKGQISANALITTDPLIREPQSISIQSRIRVYAENSESLSLSE
jgi:hypothetical protein